jgi:hypothetical protein
MHAARGMKTLRAADSADASVDSLRWRRAEVYVPSSLRPLSVLDLALPRRIKRIRPAHVPQRPELPRVRPRGTRGLPGGDAAAGARAGGRSAHQRRDRRAAHHQPRHRKHPRVSRILLRLHARGCAQLVVITYKSGLVKPATRSARTTNALLPSKRPPDARCGRRRAKRPAGRRPRFR